MKKIEKKINNAMKVKKKSANHNGDAHMHVSQKKSKCASHTNRQADESVEKHAMEQRELGFEV